MYDKEHKKWVRKALYYQKDDGSFDEAYMIFDNRDYELFGRLAGVRSCVKPFVYPRGIPDDASEETRKLYDGCDYHDATWYDYCELNLYAQTDGAYVVEEEYDDECGSYEIADVWNVVRPYVDKIDMLLDAYGIYYPKPGEVRIVIWFDS